MDRSPQTLENPETQSIEPEEQDPLVVVSSSPLFASASLSLSLSSFIPTNFLPHPRFSSVFSFHSNNVKVPTQASSLAHLCLATSTPPPTKISFISTISPNPLHTPLIFSPRGPSDPSNAAAIRRASIVWFRNDLRLHDNECLNSANDESLSVLPVYCFDPRDYGKSSSGFDKTGASRAAFIIESVADLRRNLQGRGSNLVVRVGKPETVLVELAKKIGADAVYAHKEVSPGEVQGEDRIEAALKEEGVDVKYFWGSTLYHIEDLPFKLEEIPTTYGGFKKKVKGLEIRKTLAALDQLKGFPSRGDVEPGEIPSLTDLGLKPAANMSQDGKVSSDDSMVGGETEALQKLKKFAAECQEQLHNGIKDNNYGANFSCKISPWLAMGCVSPSFVFHELKKTASSMICSGINPNNGNSSSPDTGLNWLMSELLWRDFFRFITRKYSSVKKLLDKPVTSCAGALA